MMLLQHIEKVELIIQEGRTIAENADKNKDATVLVDTLNKIIKFEKILVIQKQLLHQIRVTSELDFNSKLLNFVLEEITKGIEEDIVIPSNKLFPSQRNLENEINKINLLWQEYVKEKLRIIKESLVTFKKVVTNVKYEIEIKNLMSACDYLEKSELNEKNYQRLQDVVIRSKKVIEEINPTPEVNRFLNQALRGQATIRDLTPEIFEWLQKENLADKLKVTF